MNDPKPLRLLTLLPLLGLGWLGLWFLGLPSALRLERLTQIAHAEGASTFPPSGILDQVHWLVQHRLEGLTDMVVLFMLALILGIGEGLDGRTRDPLRGLRLRTWTLGVVGMTLMVTLGGLVLVLPWALPQALVAVVLSLGIGMVGYSLTAGHPTIH